MRLSRSFVQRSELHGVLRGRALRRHHLQLLAPHRTAADAVAQPHEALLIHLSPRQLARKRQPLVRRPARLRHHAVQHSRDKRVARADAIDGVRVLRGVGVVALGAPGGLDRGDGLLVGSFAQHDRLAGAPGADEDRVGMGAGELRAEECLGGVGLVAEAERVEVSL